MMNLRADKGVDDLWGEGKIRVFISHTHEYKEEAKEIQSCLLLYGIASFVAHEDIEPMKEWETEIERALFSMNMLVALLTEKFSESKWTDQEVGAAFGRGVPILPVRMGKDPYGFIGKYQAISGAVNDGLQIANDIVEFLFEYQGDNDALKELSKNVFIAAVEKAPNYEKANYLSGFLSGFDSLTPVQAELLVQAFNGNSQVNQAFRFYPIVSEELTRMTDDRYVLRGAAHSRRLEKSTEAEIGE